MDARRRRLRLYLRYKSQQVEHTEICVHPEWTDSQNYKALWSIHLRLGRGLALRREVFGLYADDDAGHAAAIEFVQKQMVAVEELLCTICARMMQTKTKAQQEEDDESEDDDDDDDKDAGVRTEVLRNLEKEGEEELDELQQMENISTDKMLDANDRILHFINESSEISADLRQMVEQNKGKNEPAVSLSFLILASEEGAANPNRFMFYYAEISDDAIRKTLLDFQDKQLVHKRELLYQLQHAYTRTNRFVQKLQKETVERKSFIDFGLRLFSDAFSCAGHFTTRYSISAVVALTSTTAILVFHRPMLQEDVRARRTLMTVFADEIDSMERFVRTLVDRYRPGMQLMNVPWSYLARAPDFMRGLFWTQSQILENAERFIYRYFE